MTKEESWKALRDNINPERGSSDENRLLRLFHMFWDVAPVTSAKNPVVLRSLVWHVWMFGEDNISIGFIKNLFEVETMASALSQYKVMTPGDERVLNISKHLGHLYNTRPENNFDGALEAQRRHDDLIARVQRELAAAVKG